MLGGIRVMRENKVVVIDAHGQVHLVLKGHVRELAKELRAGQD